MLHFQETKDSAATEGEAGRLQAKYYNRDAFARDFPKLWEAVEFLLNDIFGGKITIQQNAPSSPVIKVHTHAI